MELFLHDAISKDTEGTVVEGKYRVGPIISIGSACNVHEIHDAHRPGKMTKFVAKIAQSTDILDNEMRSL